MREITILINGRMVGALWVRGRIEITPERGLVCGPDDGEHAQFCATVRDGERLSYQVFSPSPRPVPTFNDVKWPWQKDPKAIWQSPDGRTKVLAR